MKKLLLFLCSVITLIWVASAGFKTLLSPTVCGPYEFYDTCASLCPPTCENRPIACAQVCVTGCTCIPGYIRIDDNGPCVPRSFCAISQMLCGPNAYYSTCASPCPPTCVKSPVLRACTPACINGCKCRTGYILYSRNGPCVPESFCPQNVCGIHQHYTECGTACPLTCDNYRNPPKICVYSCKIGCECDKGYVISPDGQCVKPCDCPAKPHVCGINEHYNECGTSCPLTCDNYLNPPKICNDLCKTGCECDEGYVLSNGRCIKPCDCPPKPSSFCPIRTSKVCIRRQNLCCTDADCCNPGEVCCEENCGYECRTAVAAPTEGKGVNEPGCPLG